MKYKRSTAVLAGTLTLLAVPASQAALVIDHFDTPPAGQSIKTTTGTVTTGNVAAAGVLGGTRDIRAQAQSGTGNVETAANDVANGLGSYFAVTTSATLNGLGGARYDKAGTGLNLNINPFTGFEIGEIYNDSSVEFSVIFHSASGSAKTSSVHAGGAAYNLTLSLGSLATTGTFDPAHVTSIEFFADPQLNGGDVQLHSIELVPEPSTYAMIAGLGLMGFGLVRRMRRA